MIGFLVDESSECFFLADVSGEVEVERTEDLVIGYATLDGVIGIGGCSASVAATKSSHSSSYELKRLVRTVLRHWSSSSYVFRTARLPRNLNFSAYFSACSRIVVR